MTYAGTTVSAVFTFDDEGRSVGMTAQRYLDNTLRPWLATFERWDARGIPVEGEVTWRFADGDFTYYRWELLSLEYDHPARFARGFAGWPRPVWRALPVTEPAR
jgi:hypothetical protein